MWIKSSYSFSNGNCVEITTATLEEARTAGVSEVVLAKEKITSASMLYLMRDSKNPGTALAFTPDEWEAFILGVQNGEFDLDVENMLQPVTE